MRPQRPDKIDKIGKYDIIRVLGQGSFGKVYLGSIDNQLSALKCIPKKHPRSTQNEIRNLRAETQLLSKLKHENVIAMKEFFETADQVVVVMEYAGDDLAKLLEKERRLPEERVRYIGKQILSAMLYLHENRILHRDLKPQNILLQGEQIKLCDFGFAKKMSASTNFLSSVKGTPLYIAPEILQNKHYTHKVDVWSLGIILYELAYGRTPFHSTSIQQLQPKILHEPVKFPRDMSANLRELIDGMLQKSDQKRYDWNQVKLHPFFTTTATVVAKPIVPQEKLIEKEEKIEIVKPIKWIAEEECAYLKRIESDIEQGRISLVDLKFDEQFCIRVTQFIGQICIDRSKASRQVLLTLLQRIVKISKIKDQKENQDRDFTRNKQIMTAIITLAIDEQDDELLMTQLELIGFLLQQNFDKVKIDTDHDDQITTLIAAKLASKSCPKSTNNCFKVLGILTSQALVTLSNSQEYFERLAQEKLLTVVAQHYTPAPQSAIVLELLEKFIHPKYERTSALNHRLRALFRGFKEEVAPILLKNGLINAESPVSRTWKNYNHDLEVYSQTVYELLRVSKEVRTQFLKHSYWKDLLGNSRTKIYFLAMIQAVLKGSGVFQLSIEVIQNEIAIEPTGNKLFSIFLIYFTPQHFNQQGSKASSAKKIEKLKITIGKIDEFLKTEQVLKGKWCKELLGFFSEEGRFFDDLLIETLYNLIKDCKEQEVLSVAKPVIEAALLLPLSEESLFLCLQMMEKQAKYLGPNQIKKIDDYFSEMAKKQAFDDYLSVAPAQCSKLLTKLLRIQCTRIEEDSFQELFTELLEKTQLLRLLLSQQLINEDLLLYVLKIINKIFGKLTSIDFLGHGGLQIVKKYFKTTNQDLKLQIIIFCSHLARVTPEYCNDLLQSGIISLCFKALNEQKELLIQKTLHLIGNLSKHNDKAYQQFQKYQIVCCILKCISQFHKNKRILKNTIYAVGNIAFHREQFVDHIKQIIKYLLQGLDNQDNHLLLNTISTISNLLRHSPKHLPSLIQNGVFSRIIEIYGSTNSPDHISYINNVLRKAVKFTEFFKVYPKESIKKLLEMSIKRGLSKQADGNVRNLRTLLS